MIVLTSFLLVCLLAPAMVASLHITTIPPLLDVPTYSLATLNEDGSTSLNILTYATPVSATPQRVWSLGLFKDTLSYANFMRTRSCVLQLLTEKHIPLIQVLGGTSGRNVDKSAECAKLGFECTEQQGELKVLPGCAYYLEMSGMGDVVDAGSHVVAICQVKEMLVSSDSQNVYLATGRLRELGIINEQGRVIQ
jgi:flavin reductase (DIM6/NTAB) family NADH-FMN oxidoreductase RutF